MSDGHAPPRLVLVHGTRMSAAQWDRCAGLVQGADVVAVDLPGHGSRVGEPFTTEAALAVIGEALHGAVADRSTTARADRPIVLAGHSLGGYLASLYARSHPDELDGLVLIGASADPSTPLALVYRAFARAVPWVGADRMARLANGVVRRLGMSEEDAALLPDGASYAALPAAWAAVMDSCGPELLREVRCPVFLVNGQWDQMRLNVRRYARACRRPHVVTIPGATHFAPLTHPAQVADVLHEALRLAAQGGSSLAAYDGDRDLDT